MIDLADVRLRRLPRLAAALALAARRPGRSGRWDVRSRVRMLLAALGIIWVLLPALLWLVAVGLLVQEWVSWWVELESSARSTGLLLGWDIPRAPQ